MNLKFIGTDGSMGLKHGEVYDVRVSCLFGDKYILVKWCDRLEFRQCPYSSPAAFAANWEKPGQKVVVREKKTVKDGPWRVDYKKSSDPAIYAEELEKSVGCGEWIWTEKGTDDIDQYWVCSECGSHTYFKTKYCGDCGRAMLNGGKDGAG